MKRHSQITSECTSRLRRRLAAVVEDPQYVTHRPLFIFCLAVWERSRFLACMHTLPVLTGMLCVMQSAGTIAFRSEWWEASTFPRELFRDCVCRRRGLLVHSKAIFVRHHPSGPASIGWAYVGSANLSESAW